jgi:hypothetical protein
MRETIAWVDETVAAIHKEQQWQPEEGEGCRTCAFQYLCPAKISIARPPQRIWQQGDLLWELAAPAADALTAEPTGSAPMAPAAPADPFPAFPTQTAFDWP